MIFLMNEATKTMSHLKKEEAIDDYFECTTYCSVNEDNTDCQTICMERHLKGNYF